jgi:hypothetical protein
LPAGLDALGDRAHTQGTGEADHRFHNGGVLRALSKPVDEGLVHLQEVYREALEVGEVRVTGAEDFSLVWPSERAVRGPA